MFQKIVSALKIDRMTVMLPMKSDSFVPLSKPKGGRMVASHRGRTAGGAKDNTIKAFEAAIAGGAEMIEFDVRQTVDGVLVINHDPDFGGCVVSEMTYQGLRALPDGADLATLEEVVDVVFGRVLLDVEIKEVGYEAETLAIVRAKYEPDQFMVTSFRDKVVSRVKELAPDVCAGLLVGKSRMRDVLHNRLEDLFPLNRVRRTRADFLACSYPLADIGVLRAAAMAGVPVVVWTVNDSWRLKRHLRDKNVAAVITDVPEKALDHLKSI